jgi:hypothetical protein
VERVRGAGDKPPGTAAEAAMEITFEPRDTNRLEAESKKQWRGVCLFF